MRFSKLQTWGGPGGLNGSFSRPYVRQIFLPQTFTRAAVFAQAFARQWFFIQTFALKATVPEEF